MLEKMFKLPETITIAEVGPRDGFQIEKKLLTIDEKVALIEASVDAGAKIIEIGSFVHPKAIPTLADTDEVARRINRVEGVEYRALGMNLKSLERAEAAGIKKVKLTVSASTKHSLSNMNRTPEQVMDTFVEISEYAKEHNIELSGAISSSFGCSMEGHVPFENVIKFVDRFIEVGVTELSLSDSTGMGNPKQVYEYASYVMEHYPQITWNLHFHNTRGMGLANVLAGMLAGVTRYDACFAGIGGCPYAPGATGNIATEDVINMVEEMGIKTTYNLEKQIILSKKVMNLFDKEKADSFILNAGRNCDLLTLD